MGISSNQARFLALTSRQIDLENRVQQICQRRLRLSSELEKVATDYNNDIGDRKMFTYNTSNSGISQLSISGIKSLKDVNGKNLLLLGRYPGSESDPANKVYSRDIFFEMDDDSTVNTATAFSFGHGEEVFYNVAKSSLGLPNNATEAECLEAAIRSGVLIMAKEVDVYTQEPVSVDGFGASDLSTKSAELLDWRTQPVIADELYKGNDVDAENKYDRTIAEVNAQDKKLQLEQSSIEVEYKAVTSEKEAVKKILDTNAAASFKYFG